MKFINSLLLIVLFQSLLVAQPLANDSERFPVSQEIEAHESFPELEKYIEDHIKKGIIPGGTFYVAHKGKVIFHKSFGNIQDGRDYQNSDIYRLASMTKAITSVAIMQLYEQGKLRLDDPVKKYIPAFAEPQVLQFFNPVDSSYTTRPAKSDVTIRHLLTHTSGIYYGQFQGGNEGAVYTKLGLHMFGLGTPGLSTLEMANMIASAPLAHDPGTKWTYGLNMEILGAIVEKISGQNLQSYFKQNILDPLGMDET